MRVKQPVAMRLDPELFAAAPKLNRALTNFIETLLIARFASSAAPAPSEKDPSMSGPFVDILPHDPPAQ